MKHAQQNFYSNSLLYTLMSVLLLISSSLQLRPSNLYEYTVTLMLGKIFSMSTYNNVIAQYLVYAWLASYMHTLSTDSTYRFI